RTTKKSRLTIAGQESSGDNQHMVLVTISNGSTIEAANVQNKSNQQTYDLEANTTYYFFELAQVNELTSYRYTLKSVEVTPISEEVAPGIFYLYDKTAEKYLNYGTTYPNYPDLSNTPRRMILSSNGTGTYSIKYIDDYSTNTANYLKIDYWDNQYLWTDATLANDTKWTFTSVTEYPLCYTISSDNYARTNVSGIYYLTGKNASTTADEAHEYVLIDCNDNAFNLNEFNFAEPAAVGGVNVTLMRTLQAATIHSLCRSTSVLKN
ncbi:MAG: hypothetical protein IJS97_08295, partial [Prevotella sp.]|nr:hypothetical protein [Prevotella sp.]